MDYDAPQWPKGIIDGVVDKPILETTPSSSRETLEKRAVRAHKGQEQEANLSCPRCNSTNTKFCYYNNYSLSQPRYFCKSCRRYWTRGGSLRNVPMGGGSRKNKRSSSSSSITSSSKKNVGSLIQSDPQNPSSIQGHDLDLASYGSNVPLLPQNPSSVTSSERSLGNFTALISDFPLPGSADSISNAYPSGTLFSSLQELKPMLHCSSIDCSNNNGSGSGIHENDNGRGHGEHTPGGINYWNSSGSGMLGGGGGSWQL